MERNERCIMTTDIAQNIADDGADAAETAETTETAYDLIGCIDNNPFFMSCFFVCRNGLVT